MESLRSGCCQNRQEGCDDGEEEQKESREEDPH